MARKQERMHNAKRARAERAKSEVSLYEVPDDLDLREETYPTDLVCGCRIVQRLVSADFALVYFAIVWAKKVDVDEWEEQYSCDTGHGHFHEHVTGYRKPNDARILRPLYSHVDVQEFFDRGYDLVQDRHDQNCGGGH
ncbi:hypothetical protein [Microbacterium aerolatum]|nr:hypothetical protein [Microbacterium aerolatum]